MTLLFMLMMFVKTSFAQDGVFAFKKVEISFAEIHQKDSLISLELYQNAVFPTNETGIMGFRFSSDFDSITQTYTLYYSYTGIGGSNNNLLSACPLLLVKLHFMTVDDQEYDQWIPVSLAICAQSKIKEIKVLHIDLNGVVNQPDKMIQISENEKYEMVAKEEIKMDTLSKIE